MKHTKPALFLDFDEVLFSTRDATVKFFEHHYGVKIPDEVYLCGHSLEQIVLSQLSQGTVPTKEVFYEHLGQHFLSSRYWHKDVRPIDGTTEVLPELTKKFDIWVATARQTSAKPVVQGLLNEFFPECIQGVHFVWEHLGEQKFVGRPKKSFVGGFENRHAFIDDNPEEVKDMLDTVQSFLFDPFGYHTNTTDIPHRVTSWEEIGKILL